MSLIDQLRSVLDNKAHAHEEDPEWIAFQLKRTFKVANHNIFRFVEMGKLADKNFETTSLSLMEVMSMAVKFCRGKVGVMPVLDTAVQKCEKAILTQSSVVVKEFDGSAKAYSWYRGTYLESQTQVEKHRVDVANFATMMCAAFKPLKEGKVVVPVVRDDKGQVAPAFKLECPEYIRNIYKASSDPRNAISNVAAAVSEMTGADKLSAISLFPAYHVNAYGGAPVAGKAEICRVSTDTRAKPTASFQEYIDKNNLRMDFMPFYAKLPRVKGEPHIRESMMYNFLSLNKAPQHDAMYQGSTFGDLPSAIQNQAYHAADIVTLYEEFKHLGVQGVYFNDCYSKVRKMVSWNIPVYDFKTFNPVEQGKTLLIIDEVERNGSTGKTGLSFSPEYSKVRDTILSRRDRIIQHFKTQGVTVYYVCNVVACPTIIQIKDGVHFGLSYSTGRVWWSGLESSVPASVEVQKKRSITLFNLVLHRIFYPYHRVPISTVLCPKLELIVALNKRTIVNDETVGVEFDSDDKMDYGPDLFVADILDQVKSKPVRIVVHESLSQMRDLGSVDQRPLDCETEEVIAKEVCKFESVSFAQEGEVDEYE